MTEGCNGCKSAFSGKDRQPHTTECRGRFERLLAEETKVKASVKREIEFYAEVTEADGKRRKKAEEMKITQEALENEGELREGTRGGNRGERWTERDERDERDEGSATDARKEGGKQ